MGNNSSSFEEKIKKIDKESKKKLTDKPQQPLLPPPSLPQQSNNLDIIKENPLKHILKIPNLETDTTKTTQNIKKNYKNDKDDKYDKDDKDELINPIQHIQPIKKATQQKQSQIKDDFQIPEHLIVESGSVMEKLINSRNKAMTGMEATFNFSNYFYKFVKTNLNHNGFTYNLGLNKDIRQFKPTGECSGGGLYFTIKDNINDYSHFGNKIAIIRLYKNSRVFVENMKIKADKIHVECIISPEDLKYVDVPNPTRNDIFKFPPNIQNYQDIDYELCHNLVSQNGLSLKYIPAKYKNKKLILKAVSQNGLALEFVDDYMKDNIICGTAISQNSTAIKFANII
jgi:hypothetical protein